MRKLRTYSSFEIWIDSPTSAAGASASYPVTVYESPAGIARGRLALDVTDVAFRTQLALVQGEDATLCDRQRFGELLFGSLFDGGIRDAWRTSLARAQPPEADGLRLRLWLSDPDLAALPWELLYDEDVGGFLATCANLPMSRYIPVAEPPYLPAQERLRILVVVESPDGLDPVQPEEVDALGRALEGLGSLIDPPTFLRNPAVAQIQCALQQGYHVLHFLGHGSPRRLALVDDDGQHRRYLSDQEFAQLFLGRDTLRLVVLCACASAKAPGDGHGADGIFAGVGPALVQKRMPAVISMQYPTVQMDTAGRFSRALYAALANHLPIDVAVNEARQQLSAGQLLAARDWSTPVLHMGTRNGRILDLVGGEADVGQAWRSVQAAAEQSASAAEALTQLSQRFKDTADRIRSLGELMRLASRIKELRVGFARCTAIVDQFGDQGLALRFEDLRRAWVDVQGQQLEALKAVLADGRGGADGAFWIALDQQAASIDGAIADVALRPLRDGVRAFGGQVAVAEARVHQQVEKAVDDLVEMSDRTLGRLDTT